MMVGRFLQCIESFTDIEKDTGIWNVLREKLTFPWVPQAAVTTTSSNKAVFAQIQLPDQKVHYVSRFRLAFKYPILYPFQHHTMPPLIGPPPQESDGLASIGL
jgi:hypothetical protein